MCKYKREMVSCCRCNRTGLCRSCNCVKAKKPCSNFLPSKLGTCLNELIPGAPELMVTQTLDTCPLTPAINVDLPSFAPISTPNFCWGDVDGEALLGTINYRFKVIVHWRKNLLKAHSRYLASMLIKFALNLHSWQCEFNVPCARSNEQLGKSDPM